MLSSLLYDLQSPFPADESGNRPAIDFERAYVLIAIAFYICKGIIEIVFGQKIFNLVTQPTWLLLYGAHLYFLYRNRDRVIPFIKNLSLSNGLMWIVIFLPLASTLWSYYPDITLRRAIGITCNGLFAIYLGTRFSLKELLFILRYILIFVVALSLVFGIVFPQWGLMQESHVGAFRGIFTHKNGAGVNMANAAIIFLIAYFDRLGKSQVINGVGFVLSCGMVFAAQSSTGLGALLLSTASIPFLFIPRRKFVQMLPIIFGALFIGFLGSVFFLNNADTILAAFGEDTRLTGRAGFWPLVIDSIRDQFWFGYGFEAYWHGGTAGPSALVAYIVETKAHAHNGFLETMLSVGFVGLAVFLCSLWLTILNLLLGLRNAKGLISFYPILFLIQFLAMNMVETSIYSFNSFRWVVYIYIVFLAAQMDMQRRAAIKFQRLSSSV